MVTGMRAAPGPYPQTSWVALAKVRRPVLSCHVPWMKVVAVPQARPDGIDDAASMVTRSCRSFEACLMDLSDSVWVCCPQVWWNICWTSSSKRRKECVKFPACRLR